MLRHSETISDALYEVKSLMLDVKKTVLASGIPFLYAAAQVTIDGKRYYAASSENPGGKAILIDAETEERFPLPDGPGGVMTFIPVPGESAMLSIEEFYPVFSSASAKIIKTELHRQDGVINAKRSVLAEVPYVHRISLLQEADGLYLVAGILCRRKTCSDDWSTPGSLRIGKYEPDARHIEFETVQDGIFKHHAMQVKPGADGFDELYFGGTEGCFRTVRQNGQWITERLLDINTSDIALWDLDGDGQGELAIIEGFHGNNVAVFKKETGRYVRALDLPASFGHVLWTGSILGGPALIAGSRAERKELTLYRLRAVGDKKLSVEQRVELDQGQAPAQIVVLGDGRTLLTTNHDAGELAKYTLSYKNSPADATKGER